MEYFDADAHVLEPRDLFVEHLPRRLQDAAIRVEWSDQLESDMLVAEGRVLLERGVAAAGLAGRPWVDFARNIRYDPAEIAAGGFDPHRRVPDMDRHGIDAATLFPTLGLVISSIKDADLAEQHCRIENEWLADYCAAVPERYFGVATVPLQDPDRASREAQRAVTSLGLRGVMIRPQPFGERHLGSRALDRFWATVQELDVPVCLHPGGIDAAESFFHAPSAVPLPPSLGFGFAVAFAFDMEWAWSSLVGHGVLDRFPRLRVAMMETGGTWMAHWLVRMDHVNEVYEWGEPSLALRPSEYFQRQGWISFDPDEATLPANVDVIGHDRIVWASDYPHQDLRSDCVRRDLDENIKTLSAKYRAAIRNGNARALYRV